MIRAALLISLVSSSAVWSHVINFEFVTPDGVGQRTDGGFTSLSWVDSFDANDTSSVLLRAQRSGLSPFLAPAVDAKIREGAIKISDPANLVEWDTRPLSPGCYQPFAVVTDAIELTTVVYPANGVISVQPVDGGQVPPAIWVLNPRDQGFDDAGLFVLRMRVDSPDDATRLTVRSANGKGAISQLASGLPFTAGIATYSIARSRLEANDSTFLQVEAALPDGGSPCAVWWSGFLTLSHDAGAPPDAGAADGGPVPDPAVPRGCGCHAAGSPGLLLAALLLLRGASGRWGATHRRSQRRVPELRASPRG